jgi:hypothetical protein
VEASDVSRAMAAAISTAAELVLAVDDTIVVQNSNKLALRLLPCDVLARVAHVGHEVAAFDVDLAQQLAETGSPVGAPDPRVEPRAYERDGFAVTCWAFYGSVNPGEVSPGDYANALERLHEGMRRLDVATPHFMDRVADAQQLVANRGRTPALADEDRELLNRSSTTRSRSASDTRRFPAAPTGSFDGLPSNRRPSSSRSSNRWWR